MKITRYVNGEKLNKSPNSVVVNSDVIKATIEKVNARIKDNNVTEKAVNE